jgi:hypothetical protein
MSTSRMSTPCSRAGNRPRVDGRAGGSPVGRALRLPWRTRTPARLLVGLAASAAGWAYAASFSHPAEAPSLATIRNGLLVLSFFTVATVIAVCVDSMRRAGRPISAWHAVRLLGCVAISIAALLIPQYTVIKTGLNRLQNVDTDARVSRMLARQDWFCRQKSFPPRAVADLHLYGVKTDPEGSPVWCSGDTRDNGRGRLQGRVYAIATAKRLTRGRSGPRPSGFHRANRARGRVSVADSCRRHALERPVWHASVAPRSKIAVGSDRS